MNRWLFFFAFLTLCWAGPASAALPPLDDSERHERSDEVFRGEIQAVYTRKRKKAEGFSDSEMILEILVSKGEKGKFGSGETVYVHCWTIQERPERWVGDGGQRPRPREGDSGLFYVKESGPGVLRLLHPNGWDRD